MKSKIFLAILVLGMSGAAFAQNAASGQSTHAATAFFPSHNGPTDINAYINAGPNSTRATDACLAGDSWQIINIGLPGPIIDVGMTDGTAEGCACTHSGGYDLGADTDTAGALTLVIGRYAFGADAFPASWELLFRNPATQIRGVDACGVSAQ